MRLLFFIVLILLLLLILVLFSLKEDFENPPQMIDVIARIANAPITTTPKKSKIECIREVTKACTFGISNRGYQKIKAPIPEQTSMSCYDTIIPCCDAL
jgi:hypothetical protein